MRTLATKQTAINQYNGLGNQLWDLAGNRPSLDLQFAETKSLVDATTGSNLVTFTRASSGTYVGSDRLIKTATTNEARFDHNPTTGESLGLLVEESRTNLLTNSESFTSWTANQLVQSTASVAAPDGSPTVRLFTEDNTTNVHRIFLAPTTGNLTQTHSVFVKNASGTRRVYLSSDDASGARQSLTFDLQTGTLASNSGGWTNPFITAYPNGWYRIGGTLTDNGGTTLFIVGLNDGALSSYLGDGTSGIYLWGAQLEAGAFLPTSYIPTTTATVTRSADVASISGSNFSGWYRQDEGSFLADVNVLSTSRLQQTISFNDGSSSNRIEIRPVGNNATTIRTDCLVSGVTKYSNFLITVADQSRRIAALAIKANDFRLQSGATGGSPASDVVPAVDRLYLNYATFASGELNGTIRRLTYWPQRLSNSTLQEITR
jgi:hypothetical protein